MNSYSPTPFIKIVVLKVDPIFESEVIDEHNFGLNDKEKIEAFKESYSSPIYHCTEIMMGGME
jgi:hypothetical protein